MWVSFCVCPLSTRQAKLISVGMAQVLVVELALCYREMVRLMMRAAHQ